VLNRLNSQNIVDSVANGTLSTVDRQKKRQRIGYIVDICALLLIGGLLFYGNSWQYFSIFSDVARYQCYVTAFWQGLPAVNALPARQCAFLIGDSHTVSPALVASTFQQWGMPAWLVQFAASQSVNLPLHSLPYEYPWLTLLFFSVGLMVPSASFQIAFALAMIIAALIMYILIARTRTRLAALAYGLYIVIAGWVTVAGRFDILPSLFSFIAVLCGLRKRWTWAFVCLALATMLKFYPVILLPVFLIVQQQQMKGVSWRAWTRWRPLSAFAAICVLLTIASFLLNIQIALAPFGYFGVRPVQAESLLSSLLWFLFIVGQGTQKYVYTFGSLNVIDPLSWIVSALGTIALVAGLLYTWWLLWRQRIGLALASLLTLLIVMVTSKVFSPQYLLWVIPLLALIGGADLWWVIPWAVISLLTTIIYPAIYFMVNDIVLVPLIPAFFPLVSARNVLLLIWVTALLVLTARGRLGHKERFELQAVSSDHPLIRDEKHA
jgi:hypothetical protein